MTGGEILLGDIGGTTARFAVLHGTAMGPIAHFPVSEYATAADAIDRFLGPNHTPLAGALLGVAGPVEGDRCVVTNAHWTLDSRQLCAAFSIGSLKLINDFEATAWSLPHLGAQDVRPVGGGLASPSAPMVVIGPGTGLGIAAFILGDKPLVIASEGGHATLPAWSRPEALAIERLRTRFGHVSAERALSGPGLENLYWAIASLENLEVRERSAAEITEHAIKGTCRLSRAATDMFCAMLGGIAGNMALTFRARGGVYIAGGIVPRLVDYLANSDFRDRFTAKGRFRSYLEAVPTYVVMHEDPAFLGLQALAASWAATL